MPTLARDGRRRVAPVAGQHAPLRFRASCSRRDRGLRVRAQRVADREESRERAVDGDEHDRAPSRASCSARPESPGSCATPARAIARALPTRTWRPAMWPSTPSPGRLANPVATSRARQRSSRGGNDRAGDSVLAGALDGGRVLEQYFRAQRFECRRLGRSARLALGQRAGLVDQHELDLVERLQRPHRGTRTPARAPRPCRP
jgi:hypothetical protein